MQSRVWTIYVVCGYHERRSVVKAVVELLELFGLFKTADGAG